MPQMSSKTPQAKTAHSQQRPAAGPKGVALTPPPYGIDFVDRQVERENNTGLPDKLKAGIENLSGLAMDDVKVHYNSSKPAQLQALAYTQGKEIHVGPGQERHLPHEAWHVVQQKQGRVRPTMQMKDGVPVNDDEGLEHEADVMGGKALLTPAQLEDDLIQRQGPEEEELLQGKFDSAQLAGGPEEEELLQGKFETAQRVGPEEEELLQGKSVTAQRKEAPASEANRTGRPDGLESGIESLSGVSLDDVSLHDNSPQAAQLSALAVQRPKLLRGRLGEPVNQGVVDRWESQSARPAAGRAADPAPAAAAATDPANTDYRLAPGQEPHVPHEAWHVVQQKQGRLRVTVEKKGVGFNEEPALEREPDLIGARAKRGDAGEKRAPLEASTPASHPLVVQRIMSVATFQEATPAGLLKPRKTVVAIDTALAAYIGANTVPNAKELIRVIGQYVAGNHDVARIAAARQLLAQAQQEHDRLFSAEKTIGKNDKAEPVINKIRVGLDMREDHRYFWPSDAQNLQFQPGDYAGAVNRAMNWGAGGGEGTAGWYSRSYTPFAFHKIADAAQNATKELEGTAPLNNESNKTLVAIRAFRGPESGAMAGATLRDLTAINQAVPPEMTAHLAAANLINNADAAVTEIKADPAEAHPNTLPTARITFGDAGIVYFKGRSQSVEDALVGTGVSAARALSELGVGGAGAAVGTHGFVEAAAATSQFGADVGTHVVGGAPTMEQAQDGWLSAAKTALLVSLTGTGDLHRSNIIGGRSGKKHIIDAEFLLDTTAWDRYAAAAADAQSSNFDVASMAPDWLTQYMATLQPDQKNALANQVVTAFKALNLHDDAVQEQVLAPIRAMMVGDALLRVSPDPFVTAFWLGQVTEHHELPGPQRAAHVDRIWGCMNERYPELHVDLENEDQAKHEILANLENGMVPLFHLKSESGHFMLNKMLKIGQLRADRSINAFLALTKQTITRGHTDILEKIHTTIVQ